MGEDESRGGDERNEEAELDKGSEVSMGDESDERGGEDVKAVMQCEQRKAVRTLGRSIWYGSVHDM